MNSSDIRKVVKYLRKHCIKPINGFYYPHQFGLTDKDFLKCINTMIALGDSLENLMQRNN